MVLADSVKDAFVKGYPISGIGYDDVMAELGCGFANDSIVSMWYDWNLYILDEDYEVEGSIRFNRDGSKDIMPHRCGWYN